MTSHEPFVRVRDLPASPAPSAQLLALVAEARPVRARDLGREGAILVGGLAIWALLLVGAIGLRGDLPSLPIVRFFAGALAWAALLLVGLWMVLRPPRGQVLPSILAARVVALLLPIGAVAIAVALLVDAPGVTRHPGGAEAGRMIAHCLSLGLGIGVAPMLILLLQGRARLLAGRGALGAALGAATGALGALVLHVVCPVGGLAHILAGHAAVLVAGALVGAAAAHLVAR